ELQKKYAPGRMRIHNSLQTNGVLLDDQWCEFLRKHDFLVGLSIDGPVNLHDKYRRDRQGRGTFDRVAAAMRRLVRHGVQFNAMTCVNRHNADHPHRVYTFLRDAGATFMQFIPIVERLPDGGDDGPESAVGPASVLPEQFGRFLTGVFDTWVQSDVGRVFVRDFDHALAAWMNVPASLCVYAHTCGRAVAIEHNGDLYSCDHFVDEEHKLGNIHEKPLVELANSPLQRKFGEDKSAALPPCCRECEFLYACNGACPKDRFALAPDGSQGLNYLCEGFKMFFSHVEPYMKAMAGELEAGRPAAGIMQQLRAHRQQAVEEATTDGMTPRRNSPCPCGSGKKYKNCCMRG
ncbi:MAG: anaerobic sulfatase maturase, partial [Planctomycetota bacterium]|nr:anaerobic sulfatase maturase [Planctomycetota bacterium]